jgi:hypothetical protein
VAERTVIASAIASSEGALELEITASELGSGRVLELGCRGGRVTLVLEAFAERWGAGAFFGEARPASRFYNAVAGWLDQPPVAETEPARRAGFGVVALGDGVAEDGTAWHALKLSFGWSEELYLRLSKDGRRAQLLEKDCERGALMRALRHAVLGGSEAGDETVAAQPPEPDADGPCLVTAVAGSALRSGRGAWTPRGFLVVEKLAKEDRAKAARFVLRDPSGALVTLAELPGVCDSFACAGDVVLAAMLDPAWGEVFAIPLDGSGARSVVRAPEYEMFNLWLAMAPDGKRIALCGPRTTRIVTSGGTLIAELAVTGRPERWTPAGLEIETTTGSARWTGGRDVEALAFERWKTPDGRFQLQAVGGGLVVTRDGGTSHRIEPVDAEERDVFVRLETWGTRKVTNPTVILLSPHQILLLLSRPRIVDLATGRSWWLWPRSRATFYIRGDARVVAVMAPTGTWFAELDDPWSRAPDDPPRAVSYVAPHALSELVTAVSYAFRSQRTFVEPARWAQVMGIPEAEVRRRLDLAGERMLEELRGKLDPIVARARACTGAERVACVREVADLPVRGACAATWRAIRSGNVADADLDALHDEVLARETARIAASFYRPDLDALLKDIGRY